MEQLNEEQAKAYGCGPHSKRVVLDAATCRYVAIAPDGTYWLVEGMEDAKVFLTKFGVY